MNSPRHGFTDALDGPDDATVLVGDEFPRDLYERVEAATDRVLVQFMTYEGDDAGWALTQRLLDARRRGVDVHAIIDTYTDRYVSDTPSDHPEVQEEVQATQRMIQTLQDAGIPVTRTRPYGPLDIFFLVRNHKKIVVVDEACYLGGINVSDHNYAWHDFMIRLDDSRLADQCASIFHATTQGDEPDLSLATGLVTNRRVEDAFKHLLDKATDRLVLSSPYLADAQIARWLVDKARQGLHVTVLTLAENNIQVFNHVTPYIHERLQNAGVDVRTYKTFSHAKFLIADDTYSLVGSTNFGLDSFLCKDEIAIMLEDPAVATKLSERLVDDQRKHLEPDPTDPSRLEYGVSAVLAHLVEGFLRAYGTLVPPFSHVLDE